jgi:arylformamidase
VTSLDHELEYNNRRRIPSFPAIAARWKAASDAYRQVARAELDLPYGAGERQRFDLFYADNVQAPLVVYIPGGYWQWGDRATYSFVANAFSSAGLNVAIASYSLCPAVSVLEIVDELKLCLATLWRKTAVRPLVIGHSAGGHLTAAMLASRWDAADDLPGDLVRSGVAISGIFDLEPLVDTSINQALGLDDESARAASPRFWPAPSPDCTLVAAVGAHESREFLRQSREMVDHWGARGVRTQYLEVPESNHFTILDQLTRPDTTLHTLVVSLARDLYLGLTEGRPS